MAALNRNSRFPELEKTIRVYFATSLKPELGEFNFEDETLIMFPESGKKILCIYSSFNKQYSKWFWGIPPKYWKREIPFNYLSLIFENKIGGFSYLLLSAKEAHRLIKFCGTDKKGHNKKINMRIYQSDGVPRFQDDKRFDVIKRTKRLYPAKKEN